MTLDSSRAVHQDSCPGSESLFSFCHTPDRPSCLTPAVFLLRVSIVQVITSNTSHLLVGSFICSCLLFFLFVKARSKDHDAPLLPTPLRSISFNYDEINRGHTRPSNEYHQASIHFCHGTENSLSTSVCELFVVVENRVSVVSEPSAAPPKKQTYHNNVIILLFDRMLMMVTMMKK